MTGRVVLVGAGPGDPDLITVKGARVLALADVVVYDRLAAPALLNLAPPDARRIYVGKEPGRQAMEQREIGALLVHEAASGHVVVRLKGGDPFVFGRGGEEMLACDVAGIPVEIVPGITSAVAAPAAARIPMTHRSVARSFAVVTGSTAHAADTIDLTRMATATDTLVVLMAAGKLAETCATSSRRAGRGRRPPRSCSGRGPTSSAPWSVPSTTCPRSPPRPTSARPPRSWSATSSRCRGLRSPDTCIARRRVVWTEPFVGNLVPTAGHLARHERWENRHGESHGRTHGRSRRSSPGTYDRGTSRQDGSGERPPQARGASAPRGPHEERGSLARALDALGRNEHITVETKAPKRRGRIVRTIVIGGGAYLLGTRAGRERYDQIVEKMRAMKSSVQDRQRSSDDQARWQVSSPDSARTAMELSDTTTTA